MPGIDPRALMSFHAVALNGSFAAAARELGWTQPAISQHVTRLEEHLGTPLVIRTVRGVHLTEAGARLLHHAQAIDDRLDRASRDLASFAAGDAVPVRVSAFPSACTTIVAPVMSQLLSARSRSAVNVELEQREPYEVTSAILRGAADIALTFQHAADDADDSASQLRAEDLGWDPLRLIASRKRHVSGDGVRRVDEFAHEQWVAGCPSCRRHFVRMARMAGFVPDIRHATDDYMVVQELVARDMSLAIVPQLSLTSHQDARIVAFDLEPLWGRRVMLVTAADEARPEVLAVATELRATARTVLEAPAIDPPV